MKSGNMLFLYFLGLVAGIIVPVQTALNAQLGRTTGHPIVTTLAVFLVGGLACAVALVATRPAMPQWNQWASVPVGAWSGGIIAMVYVILLVFLAPRLGVGLTTVLVLTGQLLASMLIDHFGILGNPVHPITLTRAVGMCMMLGGIYLITNFSR